MMKSESSSSRDMIKYKLNNGIDIPVMGLGTGVVKIGFGRSLIVDLIRNKGAKTINAINLKKAISKSKNYGITMYDTSRAYGKSEKLLGKAIKNRKREDIFIITKISNKDQRIGDVRRSLQKSLDELKTNYVDLYLLHWPQTDTFIDCWLQMEELYKEGLVKAIGVSNFHKHHLEELLSVATIAPAVNEVEIHPLMNQKPLIQYCESLGIKVIAYTPIGRMHEKLKNNETLKEISVKYNKSIAQVILKWHVQQSIIPIPNTTKYYRVKEYVNIFDFNLTSNELMEIENIDEGLRLRYDPDNCDFSKL